MYLIETLCSINRALLQYGKTESYIKHEYAIYQRIKGFIFLKTKVVNFNLRSPTDHDCSVTTMERAFILLIKQ